MSCELRYSHFFSTQDGRSIIDIKWSEEAGVGCTGKCLYRGDGAHFTMEEGVDEDRVISYRFGYIRPIAKFGDKNFEHTHFPTFLECQWGCIPDLYREANRLLQVRIRVSDTGHFDLNPPVSKFEEQKSRGTVVSNLEASDMGLGCRLHFATDLGCSLCVTSRN
jgi:hypothetical protein